MTKKILVTGGLGFIGFHLSCRLSELCPDDKLTIVDNLSSTKLDYSVLEGRASIHVCDLKNFSSSEKYDEIYHLASPVGSLGILQNNGFVAKNIIDLSEGAAMLARQSGAKLLYLSSSEVYGHDGIHDEKSAQIIPHKRGTRMEYALGKLTAEHMMLNLANDSSFSLKVVRPFNAMGPWQSSNIGFVIPKFFEAALSGNDLLVHGDGQQLRSFCHVDDLVNGLLVVQAQGENSAIYNVGNPNNVTTVSELAEQINSLCGSRSKITSVDPQQLYGKNYIEAFNKIPNIERVYKHTGWRPKIGLEQALEGVYGFYRGTAPSNYAADRAG